MLRSGRVNWLILAGVVAAIAVAVLFALSGESPTSGAGRFMSALAAHDVDKLVKYGHMPGESPEEERKQWDHAVNRVGRYYRFYWDIVSSQVIDENNATVTLNVVRNSADPGAYEQKFGLPLVRVDGEWLVDVRGIPRDMFPGLPR
jgi:hypothetical protein